MKLALSALVLTLALLVPALAQFQHSTKDYGFTADFLSDRSETYYNFKDLIDNTVFSSNDGHGSIQVVAVHD
jgi:hypothetical protein